ERARAPAVFEVNGFRLAVLAVTDHPPDCAAGPGLGGVAYADLRHDPAPEWLSQRIAAVDADAVLVTPHWGPNMVAEPRPHVHRSATALVDAGATLVAGHSAHVFHGVAPRLLYDLAGFRPDYRVDRKRPNAPAVLSLVDLAR